MLLNEVTDVFLQPMKSKEEILNHHYTQGPDGMPEIAADGLLKAMEEYRQQTEEAAFNAARAYKNDLVSGTYSFETFDDYKASLIVAQPVAPEPAQAEIIQFIADSILEQFIPQDKTQQEISFKIRTSGIEYTVSYVKSAQGFWNFSGYRPAG